MLVPVYGNSIHVGADVFVIVYLLFEFMVEGWLRDSGSIKFFGKESGLRFIERLCCERSAMTRLIRLHNRYRKLFNIL